MIGTIAHHGEEATKLPPEAHHELQLTIERYNQLAANKLGFGDGDAGSRREIALLEERLALDGKNLWWTDLANAEECLVELLDADGVREYLKTWRRRYHDVVGDTRYARYEHTAPKIDDKDASVEQLRNDLVGRIRAVYFYYSARGLSAKSRATVAASLFKNAGVLLATQSAALALNFTFSGPKLVYFIIAMSIVALIGSVISIQRRLQDPDVSVDPFFRYVELESDPRSVTLVSPIIGSLFGVVTYGIIGSRLIASGALVPTFTNGIPATTDAIMLTLLYGFLSGFSERFVPDVLSRMEKQVVIVGEDSAPIRNATG